MTAVIVPDGLRDPDGWLKASSHDGRFGSLFGRDSLIAALQLLPLDPAIADATLGALGDVLGERDDPEREEEPGKVPHEVRRHDLDAYVAHGWPVRDGELRYYGSVDASCWWLIVYGALTRHGGSVRQHRAAAGRVAAWLAGRPTPLTYERRSPTRSGGLAHQWWRDVAADLVDASPSTGHGMYGDDGAPMHGPVASTAVCALAWRALSEAAVFVDASFAGAADAARAAFASLPRFALHDGGRARADAPTSDLGIVRWTGIAEVSVPDELVTRYGLRTLAPSHPAFRVDGYHTGAVWPWDTWVGAPSLWSGVVDAVRALGGYPELYVVGPDGTLRPSAEACAVQAWTFGAVAAIEAGWDGRAWAHD